MIPRLKADLGWRELVAALSPGSAGDIEMFECAFADLMGQRHAIAFPYGRTALALLLEAWGLRSREIIVPAYTCVVVPHAVVASGNEPVFVDSAAVDFNMDLDRVGDALTSTTGAIVATSIFGNPVDLDRLDALRRQRPDVRIVQDCAHSFAAEWSGRPVQREGDAAFFGMNISKIMTSIFGGMVTTDDDWLAARLRELRSERVRPASARKTIRRLLYLLAVIPAFWEPVYGLVNRLERSRLIDHFVRYYEDARIEMPADYLESIASVEARVGLVQTSKYRSIVQRRREAARVYDDRLAGIPGLQLPAAIPGATYSHYALRVRDLDKLAARCLLAGLQLGRVIDYSCPEMRGYRARPGARGSFPIASAMAREVVNLPVYGGANLADRVSDIVQAILRP